MAYPYSSFLTPPMPNNYCSSSDSHRSSFGDGDGNNGPYTLKEEQQEEAAAAAAQVAARTGEAKVVSVSHAQPVLTPTRPSLCPSVTASWSCLESIMGNTDTTPDAPNTTTTTPPEPEPEPKPKQQEPDILSSLLAGYSASQ